MNKRLDYMKCKHPFKTVVEMHAVRINDLNLGFLVPDGAPEDHETEYWYDQSNNPTHAFAIWEKAA